MLSLADVKCAEIDPCLSLQYLGLNNVRMSMAANVVILEVWLRDVQ